MELNPSPCCRNIHSYSLGHGAASYVMEYNLVNYFLKNYPDIIHISVCTKVDGLCPPWKSNLICHLGAQIGKMNIGGLIDMKKLGIPCILIILFFFCFHV